MVAYGTRYQLLSSCGRCGAGEGVLRPRRVARRGSYRVIGWNEVARNTGGTGADGICESVGGQQDLAFGRSEPLIEFIMSDMDRLGPTSDSCIANDNYYHYGPDQLGGAATCRA